MLYHISDASLPANFSSAGNLINDNGFLHARRTLDSYEFISIIKGTLHIHVENKDYHVGPGDFLFIFPNQLHYGLIPTEGELSFYWTHFYLGDSNVRNCNMIDYDILDFSNPLTHYILPQQGRLSHNCRTNVLFVQLIDLTKRLGFSASQQCNYALSSLLLELTNEYFLPHRIRQEHDNLSIHVTDFLEWLHLNYDTTLSVEKIAEKFSYHPSYLTALFKKHTGQTITEYLNRQRIRASENLLIQTPHVTIREISDQVGISDEKYFMRLFKRYKGVTPSNYRNTFSKKNKNRV